MCLLKAVNSTDIVQSSSVAQTCRLCNPMNRSTPGLPVHHQLPVLTQTHVHQVSDAIQHLILCCSLLFLPPIPPSIRVFSNESNVRMRWPEYWSFSFSISPSNEHLGLISFRMDWLDLLVVHVVWLKKKNPLSLYIYTYRLNAMTALNSYTEAEKSLI